MKAEFKTNIHNRFDIEVRDTKTNALKQSGVAENIVLDRAYTRICNFSSYFTRIHFGSGTGTLSPDRTTLFTPVSNKVAVVEEKVKEYPVSKITKKIVLNPEEFVGQEITEVGISETTSAINTHALIKDAEGNPLSILKTELDVVTIYATVFIELQNPSEDFQFINFPSNSIVNYFLDDTTPSNTIACDRNKEMSNTPAPVITQKTGSVTVSTSNKTRNLKTRFGVSEANGSVRGIRVLNMLKTSLPQSNIYTGHNFEDVILGSGDGENKDFEIPNIYPEDIVVKKNGSIVGDYQIKNNSLIEYKLQDLTGVGNQGRGVAISSDGSTIITASYKAPLFTVQKLSENGTYDKLQDLTGVGDYGQGVAISSDGSTIITASSAAPFFTVQKLSENGTYDKLQGLTGVGDNGQGVAISQDGSTIITASYFAPLFTVQKLNENGTYEKLQDLTGVGDDGQGVAISSDSSTIITSSNSAPYFTVQKLNENGTYEKLQDLTGVGDYGRGVAISSDSSTIITSSNSAPYFTVQKLNENGTYDKLQGLTGVGNNGQGVAISQDGSTIITTSSAAPFFTVQKLSENGTYDKLQDLTGVGYYGQGVAISSDGSTIITASYKAPFFTVQKLSENGTYDKLQDLTGIGDYGQGVAISSDGSTIITASYKAPLFTVQKLNEAKRIIKFNTPPAIDDVITADYFVDYIPKSTDFVLDVDFTLQFGEGV